MARLASDTEAYTAYAAYLHIHTLTLIGRWIPEGHVKPLKPLLSRESFGFSLNHFMEAPPLTLALTPTLTFTLSPNPIYNSA